MPEIDVDQLIETTWPYDGPHDPDTVISAAQALPRLVRYLNNATGPGHRTESLHHMCTAYRIISQLAATADLLPQLLDQLAGFLHAQSTNPTVYDDRHDRPAAGTAVVAALDLGDAIKIVGRLVETLHAAANTASHLGNNSPRD